MHPQTARRSFSAASRYDSFDRSHPHPRRSWLGGGSPKKVGSSSRARRGSATRGTCRRWRRRRGSSSTDGHPVARWVAALPLPRLLSPGVRRLEPRVRPETRYAKSGSVNVAYQVVGEGPVDLVLVPGFVSHVEIAWEEPKLARFLI